MAYFDTGDYARIHVVAFFGVAIVEIKVSVNTANLEHGVEEAAGLIHVAGIKTEFVGVCFCRACCQIVITVRIAEAHADCHGISHTSIETNFDRIEIEIDIVTFQIAAGIARPGADRFRQRTQRCHAIRQGAKF